MFPRLSRSHIWCDKAQLASGITKHLGKAASVLGTIHRPISVLSPRSKKAERVACEVVAEPEADEAVVGAAEGTADDGASAAA